MSEQPSFDMSGWVALISEVQQLGLDTARTVAARFGDLADANLGSAGTTSTPADAAVTAWQSFVDQATDPAMQQQLTSAAQNMTDAIIGMMRVAWDVMSDSAATVNNFGVQSNAVDLGNASAGDTAEGKAYVHVGAQIAPSEVKLTLGDLTSAVGDVIAATAATADPATIHAPEAAHNYPVTIKVAVPGGTPPGRYYGYLFARTVPPSAVAIHVDVTGS